MLVIVRILLISSLLFLPVVCKPQEGFPKSKVCENFMENRNHSILPDFSYAWHSVGVANTSMNTVIWRVSFPANTCFESHSSQPRNTLLDCVEGGLLNNRGGGAIENMPNHMQNLVLWNYKQTNEAYEQFEF